MRPLGWVVSKKKAPGLSLSRWLSNYPLATKFLACKECLQDADAQQWAREYCGGKPDSYAHHSIYILRQENYVACTSVPCGFVPLASC